MTDGVRRLVGSLALALAAALVAPAAIAPPVAMASMGGVGPAPAPVSLGLANRFGILADTVPNTGLTVVDGDLGVSAGGAVTGFYPPGVVTGSILVGGDTVTQARAAVEAAYGDAAGRSADATLSGQDLAGMTLAPGVYRFGATAQLTGDVVLDGQGRPDPVFIFQIGTTLGSAAASRVLLTGGASACNVFWQVGSASTLGAATIFRGNLVASTAITVGAGSTVTGRLIARTGPVTIDSVAVSPPECGALEITDPAAGDFADRQVTGTAQTTTATLDPFSVTDSRGTGDGWHVTAQASRFTGAAHALPLGSLSMSGPQVTTGSASPPPTTAAGPLVIDDGPVTIASAAVGDGRGTYDFSATTLTLALPVDVYADAYRSTVTISVLNAP